MQGINVSRSFVAIAAADEQRYNYEVYVPSSVVEIPE